MKPRSGDTDVLWVRLTSQALLLPGPGIAGAAVIHPLQDSEPCYCPFACSSTFGFVWRRNVLDVVAFSSTTASLNKCSTQGAVRINGGWSHVPNNDCNEY